jgi:uncharacterized protein YozE (UPF0346 family)
MQNFVGWLLQQQGRQDAVGHAARTARASRSFPRNSKHLHVFLRHADSNPTYRRAIKTAHAEWRALVKQGTPR